MKCLDYFPVIKTVLDLFTWSQEPLSPLLPVVYWAPRGWAIYSTLWFPCLLVCSWVWPMEGDSRSQKESKMGIFIPLVPSSWCLRGFAISPQPKICQGAVCLKPLVCPHSENSSPPPTSWGLEIVLTQGFEISFVVSLSLTHTSANSCFIKLFSNEPIWACHPFPTGTLTNTMTRALLFWVVCSNIAYFL